MLDQPLPLGESASQLSIARMHLTVEKEPRRRAPPGRRPRCRAGGECPGLSPDLEEDLRLGRQPPLPPATKATTPPTQRYAYDALDRLVILRQPWPEYAPGWDDADPANEGPAAGSSRGSRRAGPGAGRAPCAGRAERPPAISDSGASGLCRKSWPLCREWRTLPRWQELPSG